MAPRKRKTEEEEHAKPETVTKRLTRSSTRLGNANSVPSAAESKHLELAAKEKKPKGKAKVLPKGKAQPKAGADKVRVEESAKELAKKMPESQTDENKGKATVTEAVIADGSHDKTIVIEHCTQCKSFKQRAFLVKDGLKGVSGITVLLNPEKPRRGCFEIREQGGQTFISLLDMKRPFKPMKDLDMQKVISNIIDKIK